ncbi:MAG TPA: hypothetical protein VJB14_07740 [Planctomycetota bacterium]|nr:hypothetical protein [Planctomycetota bacterium]
MKHIVWAALAVLLAPAQDKDSLRRELKDADLAGTWIYDDVNAGAAEARKSGKPMLIVFR